MSRVLSAHMHTVALAILGALIMAATGCAPSHPVVINPTEAWEDELARERKAAQDAEARSPQPSVARQMYGIDGESGEVKDREHSPFVVAITDIIGFPFRGAGWLARQIF